MADDIPESAMISLFTECHEKILLSSYAPCALISEQGQDIEYLYQMRTADRVISQSPEIREIFSLSKSYIGSSGIDCRSTLYRHALQHYRQQLRNSE
ncbi:MAG: hypothetical protein KDD70_18390, partial [Bdellovibrionales bacterium]|nr:hypothetical protein [Bdellovibrionales bacterium]